MPNLKKLVTDFCARPERPAFTWKRVYKEMKKFNPEMFQHIPIRIKGALRFIVVDFRQSFKKVVERIPKTDLGVDVDPVEKRLVKKFDIHDEFYFKFVLQFGEEDDSEGDSEDDSDDAFEEMLYAAFFGNAFYEYEGQEGYSDESNGSDYFDGEQDAASADAADPDSY
uniref:Uncharacterized protein n=1 Tax=Panagrolaimus davidi TaxID=227884 RepID=A0A914QGE0_9BILA